MPRDGLYLPLQVGARGAPLDLGYTRDDTGENISALNPYFCELTGLYWGWKNLDCAYMGLVHYRRHFGTPSAPDPWAGVLTGAQLEPLLARGRVFVPKKRRYYIETLYSHYAHTFDPRHLDAAGEIVARRCPDYLPSFRRVMGRRWGYMFNMMVLERTLLDSYCRWLFDVLFCLWERVDAVRLSPFDRRLFGRVAERLFNVWLDYQLAAGALEKGQVVELPWVQLERTDWLEKGSAFLRAKFFREKYTHSF